MDHDTATRAARLRAAGLRVTAPRLAVWGVLDDGRSAGGHLTAAEVAAGVRGRLDGVSTQAVYDCLDVLTRTGLARRIEPAGRPALFESRVGDNHHHLVCRGCGRAVDVDCTHGAAPCLAPDVDHGFVVDEAEVVFWGLCPDCLATAPAGGGAAARPTGGPVGAAVPATSSSDVPADTGPPASPTDVPAWPGPAAAPGRRRRP
jgi:Fur family transcriptional regulator, stress-responsive regulator